MSEIYLDRIAGRLAAARVVEGRLDDLLIAPPEGTPLPGAIYRGVVDRPMKGQGGLTLRLPEGKAWLKQAKGLKQGDAVLLQVTGFAEPGKAVPVTARLLLKSRHVIVTPGAPGYNVSRRIRDDERREALLAIAHEAAELPESAGLILRSGTEGADDTEIAMDIAAMTDLAARIAADDGNGPELLFDGPDPHMLAWRDWEEPGFLTAEAGCFDTHGITERIAALFQPRFELPGGAWLAVEPTRALVAVDVNTGGDTSMAAGLKANIATARALPAILRCRGLGGQITVDMAPMTQKDRRNLEQKLQKAFRPDPVDTVLAGWTPLGCFELQRKRERLPLTAALPPEDRP